MNTRTARLWPVLLLCGLLLVGCSRNERLEYALRFAGENRSELEKVLELYRYDDEKYAAACFLIENMPPLLFATGRRNRLRTADAEQIPY